MNLNIEEWKEFKLTDIFKINIAKSVDISKTIIGNDLPLIGRTTINNGVIQYIKYNNNIFKEKGNCISVPMVGSVFQSTIRKENEFVCTQNIAIFRFKNIVFTENKAIFLITILNLFASKYSYSRSLSLLRLKKETINLPVTEDGSLDWNFMEDYMNYINLQPKDIPKLKASTLELKTEEWKEFKFPDLFIFETGSDYSSTKAKEFPGENNFVSSSAFNNGITVKTFLPNKREGNCLTVANNGSIGSAFYQEKDFSITGDITILRLKNYKLNENIGLFLRVLIELEKPKYSYSRKWGLNRMQKSELKLPITKDGSPDWDFMEEYMNQINLQ